MAPRRSNFHNGAMMPVNPYKARNQAWVRQICDDLSITYTELAKRARIDPATLTRFMNNPRYKPNLSDTTIQKIAEAVHREPPVTVSELPLQRVMPAATVKVVGTASAGLWKDVSVIAGEDFVHEEIPVIESRRYAGYRQYALLVEGPSINRKIPDGRYAICVAWDELGGELKDGQYIHVERNRGGLQEVTIKKVRVINGRVELWPDSTDPRFQTPIELAHPDEDTEVLVRGLVIGDFGHID